MTRMEEVMDLRELLWKKIWVDGCCTLLLFYWSYGDESVSRDDSYLRGAGGGRKTVRRGAEERKG